MKESALDLVVAGTTEGVLMVESEASELSEEVMLDAVTAGHAAFQPVIDAIIDLAEHAAKQPWNLEGPTKEQIALRKRVEKIGTKLMADAIRKKPSRLAMRRSRSRRVASSRGLSKRDSTSILPSRCSRSLRLRSFVVLF